MKKQIILLCLLLAGFPSISQNHIEKFTRISPVFGHTSLDVSSQGVLMAGIRNSSDTICLSKFDHNLNPLWSYKYATGNTLGSVLQQVRLRSGNYVLGAYESANTYAAIIGIVDSSGNFLNAVKYSSGIGILKNICATNDSMFVATYQDADSTFVTKFNQQLQPVWTISLVLPGGLSNSSVEVNSNNDILFVAQNPFGTGDIVYFLLSGNGQLLWQSGVSIPFSMDLHPIVWKNGYGILFSTDTFSGIYNQCVVLIDTNGNVVNAKEFICPNYANSIYGFCYENDSTLITCGDALFTNNSDYFSFVSRLSLANSNITQQTNFNFIPTQSEQFFDAKHFQGTTYCIGSRWCYAEDYAVATEDFSLSCTGTSSNIYSQPRIISQYSCSVNHAYINHYFSPLAWTRSANAVSDSSTCLTGFDEPVTSASQPIAVFPNPASSYISVEDSEKYNYYEIFDVAGKLVASAQSNNCKTISISNLKEGIFHIRLYSENSIANGRFIKYSR